MLSISKIFFGLFLFVVLLEIPALQLFKMGDELVMFLFLLLIALDLAVNRDFRRYKALFVVEGVFLFYLVFTIFFRDFNTTGAAINDFILEQKAFIPFLIAYAICPRFTPGMKTVLKWACVVTVLVLVLIFVSGMTRVILGHVFHYGTISLSMSLLYLYCSLDEDGKVSQRDMIVAIVLLSAGLMSTRSKFYGEYVVALFMFFIYRPGMVRNMNIKHAMVLAIGLFFVIFVAWKKINYYFITGNSGVYDPNVLQSYARPALYLGMFMILVDYPIFGSGLASFANHSSSPNVNYSSAYYEYGLDKVYGLSYNMHSFISDTYYPVLAQFGLIGIALFVYFYVWIWQKLRVALHKGRVLEFSMGVIVIAFVLIESVAGTTILQIGGYMPMMLLGMIVGKYRTMGKAERKQIYSLDYIKN